MKRPRLTRCALRDHLRSELDSASGLYAATAAEAVRGLGTFTAAESASVTEQLQHALAEVARARIALKMHKQEHRC